MMIKRTAEDVTLEWGDYITPTTRHATITDIFGDKHYYIATLDGKDVRFEEQPDGVSDT